MTKLTSNLFLKFIALFGGVALFIGIILYGGYLFRKAVLLTTADPTSLGLVAFDSHERINLTLSGIISDQDKSRTYSSKSSQYNRNYEISFAIPASYVTIIDQANGPRGFQRIGFEFWSQTFEPVSPDRQDARRKCGYDRCKEGNFYLKTTNSNINLQVIVTNSVGFEDFHQKSLGRFSGIDLDNTYYSGRTCNVRYDSNLGLITIDAYDNESHSKSCNFIRNSYKLADGTTVRPRNFAKRKPDGSLSYAVKCEAYSDKALEPSLCIVQSHIGIWPIIYRVHRSSMDHWDYLHSRVQKFLAKHISNQTSINVSKD